MKRSLLAARFTALLLCVGMLTACGPGSGSGSGSAASSGSGSGSASASQSTPAPESPEERIQRLALERVAPHIKEAAAYVTQSPARGESAVTASYRELDRQSYARLTDRQKQIYDDILPKIQNLEPFTYTAEQDGYPVMDDLFVASSALGNDYPLYDCYFNLLEIFEGDTTTAITSRYFMPDDPSSTPITDPAKLEELREEIRIFTAQCQAVVDGMPKGLSAYDQYRYLATFISLRTDYDYGFQSGPQLANPYGAIQSGFSICQGYSKGMQLLCQMADLWCTFVEGSVEGDSHGWNMVQLEDGTYYVDITWSDNGYNTPGDAEWFQYFMVTQERLLQDHNIGDGSQATGTRSIPAPVLPQGGEP